VRELVRRSFTRWEWLQRVLPAMRDLGRALPRPDRRKRWRPAARRTVLTRTGLVVGALLLVVAAASVITVLWNVVFDEPFLGFTMREIRRRCDETGFACNGATSIFFTVAPLLVGSFLFVLLRLRWVRRSLVKEATERPADLVETSGDILGTVVGRDDLCNVLQEDLRDRKGRRPHVVVGGVGVGKTAVLVRLTELLARRGAVPVPIRLRDASDDLDFLEMARTAFVRHTQPAQWSNAEAERAWRRLCRADEVVVLADGLEEAFAHRASEQRDHVVRVAVQRARKRRYPLIITSRPHEALSALDAARVHLEPLSHDAALEYIGAGRRIDDPHRLARLVETANVVETPLYLELIRELHENGQLRPPAIDTRSADRVSLRVMILRNWVDALIAGTLDRTAAVPLTRIEREATVIQLGALACCGLAQDSLDVTFEGFAVPDRARSDKRAAIYQDLASAADKELKKLSRDGSPVALNIQVAASHGVRLGLVEPRTNGVRFTHSIMQAYLGSRIIGAALENDDFRNALTNPGQELLGALIMFSRSTATETANLPAQGSWHEFLTHELCAAAANAPPAKKVGLYSAAVQVARADSPADPSGPAHALVSDWPEISFRADATRDAKHLAVERLGDAARRFEPSRPGRELYGCLYEICRKEEAYPVRLVAAQEIGSGGATAFAALEERFQETLSTNVGAERGRSGAWAVDPETERRCILDAWLMPQLAGSTAPEDKPMHLLDEWLGLVGNGLPLSVEAALAQGFKYAANRRPQHPREHAEARAILVARADDMLKKSKFWFSRLTLLHALCLWGLSGTVHARRELRERRHYGEVVRGWLARPGIASEHPFVREAAELVVRALNSRDPMRFIWIDESAVATTIGSRAVSGTHPTAQTLWIPRSAGWLALDARAQQLVADLLILLNLAERSPSPRDRARNHERINRDALPPCIVGERRVYLRPKEAPGATQPRPGEACKGGCPVGLCPYPPKGHLPYREELGEAFCRNQRALLRRPLTGPAPWQIPVRSELKRFWTDMEERARV
jgi:hypothetical protein